MYQSRMAVSSCTNGSNLNIDLKQSPPTPSPRSSSPRLSSPLQLASSLRKSIRRSWDKKNRKSEDFLSITSESDDHGREKPESLRISYLRLSETSSASQGQPLRASIETPPSSARRNRRASPSEVVNGDKIVVNSSLLLTQLVALKSEVLLSWP
jgi:hypothetical protein